MAAQVDGQRIRVGTAGWAIPRAAAPRFDTGGTHLERYARAFGCVEINSSFYRPHAFATYARWSDSTPPDFRFSVKLPREITHELELRRSGPLVERFLAETSGLGMKLGPILVQLPPSAAFDSRVAHRFFSHFRSRHTGAIACEPRHPSWFTDTVARLLSGYQVARVAADPPMAPGGDAPNAWDGLAYYRLHGSPRTYWSAYGVERIELLAGALDAGTATELWCIFDNTAAGAAIEDAAELQRRMVPRPGNRFPAGTRDAGRDPALQRT